MGGKVTLFLKTDLRRSYPKKKRVLIFVRVFFFLGGGGRGDDIEYLKHIGRVQPMTL